MMRRFTVPGNPIPKARPRFTGRGCYTDRRTSEAEELVKAHARKAGIRVAATGPLRLSVLFWRKDATACDLDNLTKLVQDALNGIAYADDRQIEMLNAVKAIDRLNPRTEVEIEELPPVGATAWEDAHRPLGPPPRFPDGQREE